MKTVVVTGATKGIGLAIARKYAENGHALAICSRNNNELKHVAEDLGALGASQVFYEQCDVGNKDDIEMFAEHITEEFPQVDVLVNNAGVFMPGKITEEPEGALETMIETNLYSAYRLTRHLMPMLRKSPKGHIFNMCSIASFMAYENGGSYSISKFAMLGMSKVLRAELLETQIKVTAIMPGATYTASWEPSGMDPERFAKAEEIADMVFAANELSGNAVVEELIIRPQLGDIQTVLKRLNQENIQQPFPSYCVSSIQICFKIASPKINDLNMRKNFTWLILLLAVSVANAQEVYRISEAQAEQMMRTSKMMSNDHMSNKAETEVAGRVFWVDDWAITNTFDGADYRNVYTIFPDKIQALYWDADEQEEEVAEVNWNSAGISFDPKDNTWFDPNLPKIRDWHNYTIDSVFFQFGYLRRSHDSIIDKIIVQAYKGNQLLRRAGTGSAAGKSATVGFNASKGEGTNQTDSVHVTLTADDSSTVDRTTGTFSVRTVGIPLNAPIEMTAGEIFGVTINFESGVTDFDSDDTLYMDPRLYNKYDTIQETRLNTMFVSGRLQSDYNDLSSPVSALESFNNGMFISRRISGTTRPTRYSSGGSYIYPGDVPVAFYPRIGVHYSAKFDVGLDENTVDGYGLGDVYPNPAPKGTELNLSFAVNSRENVTIAVYDLTGKKVMDIVDGQYEAGKHRASFNASELESGMYLYTMTAGTYSKTGRFTVNN